jgi:hypothetical protein
VTLHGSNSSAFVSQIAVKMQPWHPRPIELDLVVLAKIFSPSQLN